MQISHIRISNILGIEELEFSPGGFTEIAGKNGTGKTSVLEAIKSVAKGGHDATLLRNGAEKGEIVFVLDDGMEIKRRVSQSTSTTDVLRDGKKVARPAEVVKALTDMLSVNPVEFLLAPKKDRVRVLLESMPIEADAEHLTELSGFPVEAQEGIHALHIIDTVYKQVYDIRTGTNRAVKEKEGTIKQLRQAMPAAPGGVQGGEDELQAKLDALTNTRDAELTRIQTKLDGIRKDTGDKIEALRKQIDELNAAYADIERKAATQREKTLQKHMDERAPVLTQLNVIRSNRDAAAKREQTKEVIKQMEGELETLSSDAQKQTKALADLEAYKSELLASLPIPGLSVQDGEIFRDGVPFDRLNTAQQVEIAVEIAKLRAGDLGVICVDRIECLDSASLDAFRQRAQESGLQLFVTKVADEEFSIKSKD
jgi:DNA repair exonuclease SbcCD ATPase subunit